MIPNVWCCNFDNSHSSVCTYYNMCFVLYTLVTHVGRLANVRGSLPFMYRTLTEIFKCTIDLQHMVLIKQQQNDMLL